MKRFTQLTLVAALLLLCSTTLSAQTFGYISSQELIQSMPESAEAIVQLQEFSAELQSQLETIQVEFNNNLQEYQQNLSTYTDSVRAMKERGLQDLQARFEEFQTAAQTDMQNKQSELMQPIIAKATETISKVSKEAGLVAVFDMAAGNILYYDTDVMVNVLPLAKADMGIQ